MDREDGRAEQKWKNSVKDEEEGGKHATVDEQYRKETD